MIKIGITTATTTTTFLTAVFFTVISFATVSFTAGAFTAISFTTAFAQNKDASADFSDLLGGTSDSQAEAGPTGPAAKTNPHFIVLKQMIPHPTAEQNIFIEFFTSEKYDKALYAWWDAFDRTDFIDSPNGKALYGYLLTKNHLPLVGVETLLSVKNPEKIHASLVQWWREVAPPTATLWTHVEAKTDSEWEAIFGVNSIMKTYALWERTIDFGLANDNAKAAQALSVLMKMKNKAISEDLLNITAARFLYQNGFLQPAIRYYQKVPKASDYYFEAQEEAAWSYMRLGEQNNALAITKTLVIPEFAAEVGPETVFLHGLLNLKVCDYPEVLKTLKYFKEHYRARAQNLLKIVDQHEDVAAIANYVKRAKLKSLTLAEVGESMRYLPRLITRDRYLQRSLFAWNDLETEAKVAGEIYAASLSGGTSKVGFQARYEYFKKSVESRMQAARAASLNRIQALASEEIKEISNIVQKLHIVEAEVIQQISLSDRVVQATKNKKVDVKKGLSAASSNQLAFPYDGEEWFDELTNYQVDIKKGCQAAQL